ncbi:MULTISPECIES: glycosyltransferase [unclassified Guyparkeria]|uniref:glycosyltransferase family 2 protein n=1 Tax=unclassified Guyparkeria TaxID=2626246 RepID=UPI0009E67C00|nr:MULTISPECIES: glycosyltransferase [unclassified Guyparkeria]
MASDIENVSVGKGLRSQGEIVDSWGAGGLSPMVSVCCTAYNHEKYVADAIHGFLNQVTNFPIEILIHDDASVDGTVGIIREYAALYPNIIKPVFQSVNQYSRGVQTLSFNFHRAKGKYLAICEGDDFWVDPLKLQKQFDFMEGHEDVVISYHDCDAISEGGEVLEKPVAARCDLSSFALKRATPLYTLTTFFRNHVSDMPPEFNCARYGDLFLWAYLGQHGSGAYLGDIRPAKYRVHQGGIHSSQTSRRRSEMKLSTMAALLAYYKRVGSAEMAEFYKNRVLASSVSSLGTLGVLRSIWLALKRVVFLRHVFFGRAS